MDLSAIVSKIGADRSGSFGMAVTFGQYTSRVHSIPRYQARFSFDSIHSINYFSLATRRWLFIQLERLTERLIFNPNKKKIFLAEYSNQRRFKLRIN